MLGVQCSRKQKLWFQTPDILQLRAQWPFTSITGHSIGEVPDVLDLWLTTYSGSVVSEEPPLPQDPQAALPIMSDAWLLSVLSPWSLEIPSEKHMTQEHFALPSPCGSAPKLWFVKSLHLHLLSYKDPPFPHPSTKGYLHLWNLFLCSPLSLTLPFNLIFSLLSFSFCPNMYFCSPIFINNFSYPSIYDIFNILLYLFYVIFFSRNIIFIYVYVYIELK